MKTVVVVGGSVAALRAVETLRRDGYDGRLVLVSEEEHEPYDRPPLSKQILTGELPAAPPLYRPAGTLVDAQVEVRLGARARALDVQRRRVLLADGELPYDGLIIATGARPRPLGNDPCLDGVHTLRTIEDALTIRRSLEAGPKVVVVGAGFIGAEVASSARACGLDVTIIEAATSPLTRAVGGVMGEALGRLHGANGVTLLCGRGVEAFLGAQRVEGVRLTDGSVIPADLVVVGVGVMPNTEWLVGSGLTIENGLRADPSLHVHGGTVFAAGDVVSWYNGSLARTVRGEQWTAAAGQGSHAARALLRGPQAAGHFRSSMYFWSDQYGAKIQFAGDTVADRVDVIHGDPAEHRFLAVYRRAGRRVGVLALNQPKIFSQLLRALEAGTPLDAVDDLLHVGAPAGGALPA
jgi:3-phenylpropionate/trans-cinnamate dioxygenase ferredoxin reductase subunit